MVKNKPVCFDFVIRRSNWENIVVIILEVFLLITSDKLAVLLELDD